MLRLLVSSLSLHLGEGSFSRESISSEVEEGAQTHNVAAVLLGRSGTQLFTGVPLPNAPRAYRTSQHAARLQRQLPQNAGNLAQRVKRRNKGLSLPLSRSSTFPATMLNSSSGDDVLSSAADAKAAARAKKTAAERIVLYVVLLT